MPERRDLVVWGLGVLQLVLLVVTFFVPGLGAEMWHHVASLAFVLLVSAVCWRPLVGSRRFLALGVLASAVLATASGFYLLYWKEGIRVDGYQDWGVFWHIVWSWFAAVFFTMHTVINRRAFVEFWRRSFRRRWTAALHVGGYVLLVGVFLLTWSSSGRTWFDAENYIPLSFYAWLLFAVPPYGVWTAVRWRLRGRAGTAKARGVLAHWPVRRATDLALVPMAALAVLSGIPLAFMGALLDPRGFKYVSKYWHVWPSVFFAVLVFVHAVQAWPTVQAHWRRYAAPAPTRDAAAPSRRGMASASTRTGQ